MAVVSGWDPAPEGQVLVAGWCRARDDDGQGCTHGPVHLLSAHQSTGLRSWLETSSERGLIRAYEANRADELEAMEAPLFARFGFQPIAHQDFTRTQPGGLHAGWALFVGPLLAPTEKVTFHLRLVCFAR